MHEHVQIKACFLCVPYFMVKLTKTNNDNYFHEFSKLCCVLYSMNVHFVTIMIMLTVSLFLPIVCIVFVYSTISGFDLDFQ